MLQTENLLDVLDLLVLHDLVVLCFAYVEQLSTQRKNTIIITTDDTKTSNGEGLGRVSFRQDKGTVSGFPGTSIVRVGQLRKTLEPI